MLKGYSYIREGCTLVVTHPDGRKKVTGMIVTALDENVSEFMDSLTEVNLNELFKGVK